LSPASSSILKIPTAKNLVYKNFPLDTESAIPAIMALEAGMRLSRLPAALACSVSAAASFLYCSGDSSRAWM
jgi:hypothetical protein